MSEIETGFRFAERPYQPAATLKERIDTALQEQFGSDVVTLELNESANKANLQGPRAWEFDLERRTRARTIMDDILTAAALPDATTAEKRDPPKEDPDPAAAA